MSKAVSLLIIILDWSIFFCIGKTCLVSAVLRERPTGKWKATNTTRDYFNDSGILIRCCRIRNLTKGSMREIVMYLEKEGVTTSRRAKITARTGQQERGSGTGKLWKLHNGPGKGGIVPVSHGKVRGQRGVLTAENWECQRILKRMWRERLRSRVRSSIAGYQYGLAQKTPKHWLTARERELLAMEHCP